MHAIAALACAAVACTAVLGLPATTTHAADIKFAVRTDISSIDPHFHVYVPNRAISRHIFDSLVRADPRGRTLPGLAQSWHVVADDV